MPTEEATKSRIDNIKPAMDHLALDIADLIMEGGEVPMNLSLALQALALYRLDDGGLAVFMDDDEDDED
jgi:hypothetical protein